MTLTLDDLRPFRTEGRHLPGGLVLTIALGASLVTWAMVRGDADAAAERAARRLAMAIEVIDAAPPAARAAVLAATIPPAWEDANRPAAGSAEAWRDAERVLRRLRDEVGRTHRLGLASVVGADAAIEPRLQIGLSDGTVVGLDLGPAALGRWTGRR